MKLRCCDFRSSVQFLLLDLGVFLLGLAPWLVGLAMR